MYSIASSPYFSGTVATFSCNDGFGLSGGDGMRTCGGDGSSSDGMWSGTSPTCDCMLKCYNITIVV